MPVITKGRKMLPAVAAVVLGLLVAAAAWTGIMRQIKAGQAAVTIVVPRHDIMAYTPITAADLAVKTAPAAAVDGYTLRDAAEAAGKAAAATLYAGKPIDRRNLIDSSVGGYAAAGYDVVGVVTDVARSAGVRDGDVVDVYCLQMNQTAQAGNVQAGVKVATEARVLRICDEQGQPLEGIGESVPGGGVIGGVTGAVAGGNVVPRIPRVVYLLVRAEEAPNVAPGAWDKGAVMVLVRKPYAVINGSSQGIAGQTGQQQPQPSVEQPSVSGESSATPEKASGGGK